MALTLILSLAGVSAFVLLMSVGLLIKGKPLTGTCASQNATLNQNGVCGVCGQSVGSCENESTPQDFPEIAR